jgi:serine/threonine-protein kinase
VDERIIADRYRLEGRLGSGGMSTVHLAFDERLERLVAVKLLAEHLADDPAFVSRFQREALAAARLIHPNIVQVFDSGLDEDTEQHFIVMEYIEGKSCAEILRERGYMPVDEALVVVLGACAGLDYAHRKGVVHRDVKPGNLLRGNDRSVKLADFGIAKATEQSSITQVGSVLGTAAYLAPEQGRGEEAGPPADIYALGVVTYQLLSGRLPYEGASLTELAIKQQQEEPPRLDKLVAAVTPELASAVAVALRIDQHLRYPTAADMGRAIDEGARGIAPGKGSAIVPPLPGEFPEEADGGAETRVVGVAETRATRPRAAAAGAGGGAVAQRRPRIDSSRVAGGSDDPRQRGNVARRPPPAETSDRSENMRLAAIIGGLVVAVVIIAILILSLQTSRGVTLQRGGFSHTAATAVGQLQNLVDDNSQ